MISSVVSLKLINTEKHYALIYVRSIPLIVEGLLLGMCSHIL